jgi:hypothetical protein
LQQTLQTLQRLRVGTESVRSWYGAGLVLVEVLINEIHRFILLLIYNLCVNLGGGNSGMSQQLARCVDVCTKSQHHGSESMPSCMEGNLLGYTYDSAHFLIWLLRFGLHTSPWETRLPVRSDSQLTASLDSE